jgi:hypothetical protein
VTSAASARLAGGTTSVRRRRRRAARRATGSTPRTPRIVPSSPSSPSTIRSSSAARGIVPSATSVARAMGRSKAVPSLRTSAGARFTVTRRGGSGSPALARAAPTRSRLSFTPPAGSPTIVHCGKPRATSTSTSTSNASMPWTAADRAVASMPHGAVPALAWRYRSAASVATQRRRARQCQRKPLALTAMTLASSALAVASLLPYLGRARPIPVIAPRAEQEGRSRTTN